MKVLKKGRGVYVIAGDAPIKFVNFTAIIAAALGKTQKIWPAWLVFLLANFGGFARELQTFSQNRQYDISKARKELGFEPKQDLEKGIRKMVDWYLKSKGGHMI